MTRDEQIGKNVQRLRGDMTQQALADLMRERGFRWSQATVWSVEKGERPLRVSEGEALTDALDIGYFNLTGTDIDTSLRLAMAAASEADREITRWTKAFIEAQISIEFVLQDAREKEAQVSEAYAGGGGWLDMTPTEIAAKASEEYRDYELVRGSEDEDVVDG